MLNTIDTTNDHLITTNHQNTLGIDLPPNNEIPKYRNKASATPLTRIKKTSGFTIIELMVVVAIIGILSSISITGYQFFKDRAEFSTMRVQADNLRKQVERCFNLGGRAAGCEPGGARPDSPPANVAAANGVIGLSVAWVDPDYTVVATKPLDSTINGAGVGTYTLTGAVNLVNGAITWVPACVPADMC